MSKRWLNNFIAICVVLLFWMMIFMTAGCAGKGLKVDVQTSGEGANETKSVKLTTDYQIENGFKMERDGDGYKIDLGSATTKDAEVGIMIELLRMVQTLIGMPTVVPNNGLPFNSDIGDAAYEAGIKEGRRIQIEELNRSYRNN